MMRNTMQLGTCRWVASPTAMALTLAVLLAASATAQNTTRVGGAAYTAFVSTSGTTGQVVLPETGGMVAADADNVSVPGAFATDAATSITTGAVANRVSSAQSTSHLENVSVLGGLITAQSVIAVASSTAGRDAVSSNGLGSGFTALVVNGVAQGAGATPNTRVELSGVGYVLLNEQIPTGNGASSSGITVNMIHVVLVDAVTGQKTGDVIVGSAQSSVGS